MVFFNIAHPRNVQSLNFYTSSLYPDPDTMPTIFTHGAIGFAAAIWKRGSATRALLASLLTIAGLIAWF
jgi:hypothetical protein